MFYPICENLRNLREIKKSPLISLICAELVTPQALTLKGYPICENLRYNTKRHNFCGK